MLNLKHRNGKSKPKRIIILGTAVLIGLALTPYNLISEWLPFLGYVIEGLVDVFGHYWSHLFGHLAIFVLMGTAVLLAVPKLQKKPWIYFLLMGTIAFMQEFLQLIAFKHRPVNGDDVFDFVTDMFAATVTYLVITRFFKNEDEGSLQAQRDSSLHSE